MHVLSVVGFSLSEPRFLQVLGFVTSIDFGKKVRIAIQNIIRAHYQYAHHLIAMLNTI